MNILFISTECFPFVKTSSLSDITFSLAKGIEKEGHNVTIFLPRYGCIDPSISQIERLPGEFKTKFNDTFIQTAVYKGILPGSFVNVFFIESQNYFSNSKEIYQTKKLDEERFKFFALSALEAISRINLNPDVIHLFNPRTAYVANLIRSKNIEYSKLNKTALIFTIQSLSSNHSKDFIPETKEVIKLSNLTTTVSKTYAYELLSDMQNCGLKEVLSQKKDCFCGIQSGINEDEYNPEGDSAIAQTYSKNYFSIGKKKCKEDLQKIFDLGANTQLPLFGMVSDLSYEKGLDILISLLPQIASLNLQLVILGKGELSFEQELTKLSTKYKNLKVLTSNDQILSKKIYAGSDFFLSPKKEDPNGLSVLIAMRYGAIPISYAIGAIKDILTDVEFKDDANGIIFKNYTKEDLLEAINKAIKYYKTKDKWPKLVKEAMSFDSLTTSAAKQYTNCYERVTNKVTARLS